MSERALGELREQLAEIQDLAKADALLRWDQQTHMPDAGSAVRAEQLATLSRIAHERFASDEIGRLLEQLRLHEESLPYDSDEASLIRVTRRDWEKERRVPVELRAAITRAGAEAYPAWVEARRASAYESFLPYLERNLELKLRYLECFPEAEEPYDPLLDDFEPGMRTAEVRAVFDVLKAELPPIVAAAGNGPVLKGPFPIARQRELERTILERLGFDTRSWRLDDTVHPFATSIATTDIRITTRHSEDDLEAFFSTLHEFGHGLYERNVSPALERTPLARGASLGLHESQSRMWENLVGRGLPFLRCFYPTLQAAFPELLEQVELDSFYRAINRVEPSLIRVQADEVTYSFHIILRFELEQELVSGRLGLRELPEAWNARMEGYLGVRVPDDAHGVLQDVHWSRGTFGYFPTYALGNVIAVQLWERALADLPDLDAQLEQGEFGGLRDWLREHLHRHGRKFTPKETMARIVGGPIDPRPYVAYLRRKVEAAA